MTYKNTTNTLITLMKLILSQNYFIFQNKVYQPEKRSLNEITYLKHNNRNISTALRKHEHKTNSWQKIILQYTNYEDDILFIYDTKRIHPNSINSHINHIHNHIKLNPTYKKSINFLHLSITRKQTSLEIDIFRKPTTFDTRISFLSNHPDGCIP